MKRLGRTAGAVEEKYLKKLELSRGTALGDAGRSLLVSVTD